MKPSLEFAKDFSVLHLIPGLSICSMECSDPDCRAVHGFALDLHWGFWSVALLIHYPPPAQ